MPSQHVSFCRAFSPGGEVFPVNPQCKHILTGCGISQSTCFVCARQHNHSITSPHEHTLADIGFRVCSRGPGHVVEPSRTLITVDSFSVVLTHTPCIHLHSMGGTCALHSFVTMIFYTRRQLYEDTSYLQIMSRAIYTCSPMYFNKLANEYFI